MVYFVYILSSLSTPKTYGGFTSNLERRLGEHNSGKSSFTKKFLPWQLIHVEEFSNKVKAIEREKYLKTTEGRIFLRSLFGENK